MDRESPQEQLDRFIDKYSPEIGELARTCIENMRSRLPRAIQMVYDNYNALAIGFGPNERVSDAIFSIALYPRWVSLFFLKGADLPDPKGLLQGSGNVARHIRISGPGDLDSPAVEELITAALDRATVPIGGSGPGRLIIKSISAKQRPRMPAS